MKKIKEYKLNAPINILASLNKKQARSLISGVEKGAKGWPTTIDFGLSDKTFEVYLDYPLDEEIKFNIKIGKVGSIGELALKIARQYKKIYKTPAKYGIWGHCINNLALEKIRIFDNDVVEIDVGS